MSIAPDPDAEFLDDLADCLPDEEDRARVYKIAVRLERLAATEETSC